MEASSKAEQLLRRCQSRDEAALAELMQLMQQRVFRFALRVAGNASLAEEATVACFYRVWTACRQWRGDQASAEAWILRIAQRAALDAARGRRRWWQRLMAGSHRSESDVRPGPLEQLIEDEQQRQLAEKLQAAVASLAEEDRALVHLYYFENQSLTEIAGILESTRDALKMRLLRIRRRLGKLLELNDGV